MFRCFPRRPYLSLFVVALTAGCGWFMSSDDEQPQPQASETASLPAAPTEAIPAPVADQELRIALTVGDRFPFARTVVHELSQNDAKVEELHRSTLDLLFTLSVEEQRDDRWRLAVLYHRIRYRQDIAGDRFEYDSAAPGGLPPPQVVPYQGLVDGGFSFWIDPAGQVRECVGFQTLLERCTRDLPAGQRTAALAVLTELSPADAVAQFIDESLVLLPSRAAKEAEPVLRVGQSWTRERQTAEPVPLAWNTRCTLKAWTPETAEVELLGTISPLAVYAPEYQPVGYVTAAADLRLQTGHSFGHCVFAASTGLPQSSQLESRLILLATRPDGSTFEQRKRTVTTLRRM